MSGAAPAASPTADVDPHHGQQIVSHGYTVLLSSPDGTIAPGSRQGLFDHDTRVLSTYELLLDGVVPSLDTSGLIDSDHWTARLTVPRPGGEAAGPQLPQDALELTICRRIGSGMLETLQIDNHSAVDAVTSFAIRVDADFCDIGEVGGVPQHLGQTTSTWDERDLALTLDYRASCGSRTFHRALRIRLVRSDSRPVCRARELTFEVTLPPCGSWLAELAYEILVDGRWRSPLVDHPVLAEHNRLALGWRRDRAHIESDPSSFATIVEGAADDLGTLRNWEYDVGPEAWIPNAGLPTYTGLFGRDTVTAAWQAALVSPELLRGAIAALAATQADFDSAWHDAEPGKMVHEIRRGPLSELNIIPQRHYYGTQTASSFFVVTLSELWHWTGDTQALRQHVDAAQRMFDWAHGFGDRDGDGFLEYERRSARGLKNHAWKDSDEAIRYPDGRLVSNPIATIEEQAFHWLALQRMAEILLASVRTDEAHSSWNRRVGCVRRGNGHSAFQKTASTRWRSIPRSVPCVRSDPMPAMRLQPVSSQLIQMAQTLLGIYPFAPAHLLVLVNPTLPRWVKTVIVRNIRVGDARASLRFERTEAGATTHTVFEKTGPLHVLRVASPQQHDGLGWRGLVSCWLLEHAPGRTAAVLRIALGADS